MSRNSLIVWVGAWLLLTATAQAADRMQIEGVTLQDPTRPAGWQERPATVSRASRPNIRLDSIIYSPQRKLAVLDGHSLLEGQQHNGVRLVKVESRRVLLEWQGMRWYASIASPESNTLSIRRTQ